MGVAVEITRTDHTAAKTAEGAQVRRLRALALILGGHSREHAAKLSGMDRQTLQDRVHRYNASGEAGLASSQRPPRRPADGGTRWPS